MLPFLTLSLSSVLFLFHRQPIAALACCGRYFSFVSLHILPFHHKLFSFPSPGNSLPIVHFSRARSSPPIIYNLPFTFFFSFSPSLYHEKKRWTQHKKKQRQWDIRLLTVGMAPVRIFTLTQFISIKSNQQSNKSNRLRIDFYHSICFMRKQLHSLGNWNKIYM